MSLAERGGLGEPCSQLEGPLFYLGGPQIHLGGPQIHLGGPRIQPGGPRSTLFSRDEATLYERVSVCWLVGPSVGLSVILLLFGLLGATHAV